MTDSFTIPTHAGGAYVPTNPTYYVTYLFLVGNAPQHAILQGVN